MNFLSASLRATLYCLGFDECLNRECFHSQRRSVALSLYVDLAEQAEPSAVCSLGASPTSRAFRAMHNSLSRIQVRIIFFLGQRGKKTVCASSPNWGKDVLIRPTKFSRILQSSSSYFRHLGVSPERRRHEIG